MFVCGFGDKGAEKKKMGTDVEKDKDEEEGEVGFEYLRLLFDPDRFGFRRVADRILLACLDYHSFVAFKRSCRSG